MDPSRVILRISMALALGGVVGVLSACAAPDPYAATRAQPVGPPRRVGTSQVERGRALERAGDIDGALNMFERAIEFNPELTVAYLGAGDIYRKRGDFRAAERHYSQATVIEPRNFDAQYFHGLSLQLLNRFAEAVRAYLRALAIRPNDLNPNLNIATAYLQLEEPRQALVYGVRAVRIDGDSGPARANLGAIYAALARYEAAVAEYQQAAELMELNPELLLNLADSLSRTGRHDEAINTLEQVIRTNPGAIAYERLGAAAFRMRDYETAQESFELAIDFDQRHYPALNGLAVCRLNAYVWSGEIDSASLDEAIRLLRRSLQLKPNQPRIVELLRRYG